MHKKVFLLLISVLIIIGITWLVYNGSKSSVIKVTINGDTSNIEVKKGKVLTYSVGGDEYQFKIINITNKKIDIKVNKYGLTNTNSLLSKDDRFTVFKGEKLLLHTQTTDYQASIVFSY